MSRTLHPTQIFTDLQVRVRGNVIAAGTSLTLQQVAEYSGLSEREALRHVSALLKRGVLMVAAR